VWFEDFDDVDETGQILRHTYMVTEGMVWTHAYEELNNTIMNGGRPQSMELDPETIQGEWSNKINPNYEIFIINDAIITKLCALGENTEPCFIGSSIVPIFSEMKEESFVKELLEFKTKFSLALENKEGGNLMSEQNKDFVVLDSGEAPVAAEPVTTPVAAEPVATPEPTPAEPIIVKPVVKEDDLEISSNSQDKIGLEDINENDNTLEEFTKKNPDEDEDEKGGNDASADETEEEDDEQKKKASKNSLDEKYALLEQQFNDLQNKYAELEQENASLVEFKAKVEDKEKDALINSFYMLSDEDKKEVIENKSKYTLDDIEKELSVICVRKKVNFNLEEEKEEVNETAPTIFNIESNVGDELPAWLKAVEARKNAE
jgi:hypothetical protein